MGGGPHRMSPCGVHCGRERQSALFRCPLQHLPRSAMICSRLSPLSRRLTCGLLSAACLVLRSMHAAAQFSPAEYQHRREALLALLPESAIVVALGAHEPSQDYLAFYQSASFNYLTGYLEPDAVLVMAKSPRVSTSTLFVEARLPAREMWVGARLGTEGATRRTGLPARDVSDFAAVL